MAAGSRSARITQSESSRARASTSPCGPTIMLLPRQRNPSAKLTMSAPATNMLLSRARARNASSHSAGGPSQAVGTSASSAPPAAAHRASSGKRVSKQIQPLAATPPTVNTGTSSPAVAHEVSAPNRCSLR